MTLVDTADRLARPLSSAEHVIWLDGSAMRYPPRTILRLTDPETIGWDGELRRDAPFELVVVREVVSAFSLHVDRAQFRTSPRAYPAGALVDPIATSPLGKDRPIYRGFEDI